MFWCWAAPAALRPAPRDRVVKWYLLLSLCTVLWTDSFPVTNWKDNPDLQQEIRVQTCDSPTSTKVEVERRLVREYYENGKLKREQVSGWSKPINADGSGTAYLWIYKSSSPSAPNSQDVTQ